MITCIAKQGARRILHTKQNIYFLKWAARGVAKMHSFVLVQYK